MVLLHIDVRLATSEELVE